VDRAQRLTLLAHAALVAAFLWMAIHLGAILLVQSQVSSNPADLELGFLGLTSVPVILAILLVRGSIAWARSGQRRTLLAADILAIGASWTVLLVLLFADESPLLAIGLEAGCLAGVVAVVPPRTDEAVFRPHAAVLVVTALFGMAVAATGLALPRGASSEWWAALLVASGLTSGTYSLIAVLRRR
jgi:hypothetical protein